MMSSQATAIETSSMAAPETTACTVVAKRTRLLEATETTSSRVVQAAASWMAVPETTFSTLGEDRMSWTAGMETTRSVERQERTASAATQAGTHSAVTTMIRSTPVTGPVATIRPMGAQGTIRALPTRVMPSSTASCRVHCCRCACGDREPQYRLPQKGDRDWTYDCDSV